MEHINAFVVPIWKISVKNWNEKKKLLLDLPDWGEESCNSHGFFSDYYLAKDAFMQKKQWYNKNFIEIIEDDLKQFVENLNIANLDIGFVWAQKYQKREGMGVHTHGGSGISAVLYAEFDENEHDATQFISPFHDAISNSVLFYEPKVKEGDIVLFPSFLLHHASQSASDVSRTIFSFNAEIR